MTDFYDIAADYEALGDDLVPKVLDEGKYTFKVTKAEAGQTAGGKQKIGLTLEVQNPGPDQGHSHYEQLTWSPESKDAARIMSNALAIMGATPKWIRETRPSFPEIAERLVGAIVECGVKQREYQGQMRNNVYFNKSVGHDQGNPAMAQTAPPALGQPSGGTGNPATLTSAGLGNPNPPQLGQNAPQEPVQQLGAPQAQQQPAAPQQPAQPPQNAATATLPQDQGQQGNWPSL